jgi:ER membrane protein complex subunit 1
MDTNGSDVSKVSNLKSLAVSSPFPLFRSLNLHSRIVASRTAIHVIAFAKSFAGYTLHVTTIDPLNGKEINTYHIPSSIQNGISDIVIIDRIDNPYVAWAEKGSIKSYDFVTGHITSAKEKNYAEIIDVGLGQQGLFVGIQDNGAAHIFSVGRGQSQGPIKIWEFADSVRTRDQGRQLVTHLSPRPQRQAYRLRYIPVV